MLPTTFPRHTALLWICLAVVAAARGEPVRHDVFFDRSPRTGTRLSVSELTAFATDHLGVDYMFWCTQEPFYSEQVVPYVHASR